MNCSAFVRYYLRERRRHWFNLVSPVLGFLICTLLWLSLRWRAKELGIAWIAIGLAWGAYNTRGFSRELVNLEVFDSDDRDEAIAADHTAVSQR